ncbi:MAG: hypothetical protein OXC15_15760, partial [Rhodospirillaceae bacterium]|nr:hypothetical protein [Rhodospirillaceae bacterium]
HVLVLGEAADELWLLGEDGRVADTGLLVPASGGTEIAVHYERLPIRPRYRIGDALPFLPTGERFAAMRMTDRLAAEGTPLVLPFPGRTETVVRLAGDGTLAAEGGGTDTVPGTWRWSRGELVVTLAGTAGAKTPGPGLEARYPWRVLANQAGMRIR